MNFNKERKDRIAENAENKVLCEAADKFVEESARSKYCYNFTWGGLPIIQFPQDMVAVQEIVWAVKPDLIIETGIARGGSLIYSASLLAMMDYCDAAAAGNVLDPKKNMNRMVLGVDIDIREHNKTAIENHPLAHKIKMKQGSSVDPSIIKEIREYAKDFQKILVLLDSNHTHEHVLAELNAYAPLVSENSYCVVFDTLIENMPEDMYPDRSWGKGNNAGTAVAEYLQTLNNEKILDVKGKQLNFEIDKEIENKLLVTVSPNGYLKRV
jgi:cephalosporin hydroxylase